MGVERSSLERIRVVFLACELSDTNTAVDVAPMLASDISFSTLSCGAELDGPPVLEFDEKSWLGDVIAFGRAGRPVGRYVLRTVSLRSLRNQEPSDSDIIGNAEEFSCDECDGATLKRRQILSL